MEKVYKICSGNETYSYDDEDGYRCIATTKNTKPYAVKCENKRCEALGKEIKPTKKMDKEFESNLAY
jgi:hypothetical protein